MREISTCYGPIRKCKQGFYEMTRHYRRRNTLDALRDSLQKCVICLFCVIVSLFRLKIIYYF